jgi:hypothetical protein
VNAASFVAYAYQPPGHGWANWPTFLDPITLGFAARGAPTGGEVSSIVGGTDWSWSGPRAWDGDPTTVFSSDSHGGTDLANEWAMVDVGGASAIAGVTLVPRALGYGFPVDFSIQTSSDSATWTDVPGEVYATYANPGAAPVTLTFATPVAGQYLRVNATRLGQDDVGNHYLQLAEIMPVLAH